MTGAVKKTDELAGRCSVVLPLRSQDNDPVLILLPPSSNLKKRFLFVSLSAHFLG